MDDITANLIRDRLARIEQQNDEQLALLNRHIELDEAAHKVLERHSTYFRILGFGAPAIVGYIATKLGIK
jgi:hypothetical protein